MILITNFAIVIVMTALVAFPAAAQSRDSVHSDRIQTNRDIWVQPGETTGNLSCINCSIHVRGEVAGDVAAIHGSVTVEPAGQITGDVASILGDIRVESNASVRGDTAAIGGRIHRDPGGIIGGDQAAFAAFWLLLLALVPLAVLALIIALIVWLVQRSRQRAPHPV